MELSESLVTKINELCNQYPVKSGALLPILYMVQKEYGYLSEDILREVSLILHIPEVHVFGVATFYSMIHTVPQGKNIISVCTNIACSLAGGEHIVKNIERLLGIKEGETTKDNRFTLKSVECLGACGVSPVMMVNGDLYESLTEEKIKEILEKYK